MRGCAELSDSTRRAGSVLCSAPLKRHHELITGKTATSRTGRVIIPRHLSRFCVADLRRVSRRKTRGESVSTDVKRYELTLEV
ncbi:hypothetical protein ALC53_00368 [Atta colombica]|uniref:Uncharacterized protein n=1 Tax=Atta colombica TaxID=520822 RepID=A0A195BX15_9HYME|nr:hypothetical protein ALC53_00368 [Atta colombica]